MENLKRIIKNNELRMMSHLIVVKKIGRDKMLSVILSIKSNYLWINKNKFLLRVQ